MQEPVEIAKTYFDLSNNSDLLNISKLLTESTTYSSANTGIYLGAENIMEMQEAFHGSFKSLEWIVNSVDEIKPGIVLFDYNFVAIKNDGSKIMSSGLEYVVIHKGKIQHIEIKNKAQD